MNNRNSCKDPMEVLGRSKGYSQKELIKNLPRHYKYNSNLLNQIKNTPEVILRNLGSPIAKKVDKMLKEIFAEAYRAKQFTRTEINNKSVLFGVVLLKHKVMDLVLDYFHKRWPQCIICLYNEHTQLTGIINEKGITQEIKQSLKEVVKKISRKRQISPYFEDIQFSNDEIFETLYQSQNIKERKNTRYFNSMIPKHCFKLPGMRKGVEKRFTSKNKKIEEYFK
ncbi:MAG: DUF4130 domain-containing protein [Candidatus Lokiarchaeota archaeon]|nr:DUF4130 domain-containing protein [Candidatus Lokiarchaeota archaeon]